MKKMTGFAQLGLFGVILTMSCGEQYLPRQHARMHACVRACVRARARACVHACTHATLRRRGRRANATHVPNDDSLAFAAVVV